MNTCKTCRFWDTSDWVRYSEHSPIAICTCPKLQEGTWQEQDDEWDRLMYSYEECGYFLTGEDFGCVHHQEREE